MEQKAILQSMVHLKLLTSVMSVPQCRCRVSSTSEVTGSNPSLETKFLQACGNVNFKNSYYT